MFCNWTHADGAWEESPREWVAGLGCDALILNLGSHEAMIYAMNHVNDRPGLDPGRSPRPSTAGSSTSVAREWARSATGVVVLRHRSSGPNWTRAFRTDGSPAVPGGIQLQRMFAGADFLGSHSGVERLRELMSAAWRLVDGHRLDQGLVYKDGAYKGQAVLAQGVDEPVRAGGSARRLGRGRVRRAAPPHSGASRAHSLASSEGVSRRLCLSTIRDLIARGFLVKDGA